MDHLLDYDSSSSSNCSKLCKVSVSTSLKRHLTTNEKFNILACNEQNAILHDIPSSHVGIGSGCCTEKVPFNTHKEGDTPCTQREVRDTTRVKKRKFNSSDVPRIIIAGEHDNVTADCKSITHNIHEFERTNPHWEGRWAGHLFLPFPPLDRLDTLDEMIDKEEPYNEMISIQSERNADDNDDDKSEATEDDDTMSESRAFLPVVRILIRHWAVLLEQSLQVAQHSDFEKNKNEATSITILPHIPMSPVGAKRKDATSSDALKLNSQSKDESSTNKISLHVSLSRPIYLPAPSVDSFLSSISKCIDTILSVSSHTTTLKGSGRIFYLRPRDAVIFTNDQQTRSFLTIPITGSNVQWVKRVLLPPINSTMNKFGLESYYSEEGESCVLHVSVASMRGNMVKRMHEARSTRSATRDKCRSTMRSISLFPCEKDSVLSSIPVSIPIRLDWVRCQFGTVKKVCVKL